MNHRCEQYGPDFESCPNPAVKLVTWCYRGEAARKHWLCEDHLYFVDVHPTMTILKVEDGDGNV